MARAESAGAGHVLGKAQGLLALLVGQHLADGRLGTGSQVAAPERHIDPASARIRGYFSWSHEKVATAAAGHVGTTQRCFQVVAGLLALAKHFDAVSGVRMRVLEGPAVAHHDGPDPSSSSRYKWRSASAPARDLHPSWIGAFTGNASNERFSSTDTTNRGEIANGDLRLFGAHPLGGVGVGVAAIERDFSLRAFPHTEYTRLLAEHEAISWER